MNQASSKERPKVSETPQPPNNENPFLRIYYEDAASEDAPTVYLPGTTPSEFPTERIPSAAPRNAPATERLPPSAVVPASVAPAEPQRRRSSLLLLLLALLVLALISCGVLAKTGLIFGGGASVALLPTATPNHHLGDLLTVTPAFASATAKPTLAPSATMTPTPMPTLTPTPTVPPAVLHVAESSTPYTCVANSYPIFTVSNAGDRTLNWTVMVIDPSVMASPTNGSIAKNGTAQQVILMNNTDNNRFTVDFTSNGGSKSFAVKCG